MNTDGINLAVGVDALNKAKTSKKKDAVPSFLYPQQSQPWLRSDLFCNVQWTVVSRQVMFFAALLSTGVDLH